MNEELCTVHGAARELSLHPKTVLRYIHEGKLAATRIGKAWRIPRNELRKLSGLPVAATRPAGRVRITAIAEIEDVGIDAAGRIATVLSAVAGGREPGSPPLQLNVAHNPIERNLKVVLIGGQGEVSAMLGLLEVQLDNLP